ncbi:bifunctional 5-dehydro-2-deoxygluconokinase/5-dehydro-2-deoxyphosphogluconate aldolase [Afipia massiliensis]|nr:5-dehydro-2-deoxygluconokinase [Afipia massiliensis]
MMKAPSGRALDIVTLGRAAVDLYGEQIGGRLEDMTSFAKYLGGCPANIATGASRLGMRTGMIARVGDEHMGRFVRETLEREGVDVSQIRTDPSRLTALVILGIRDRDTFPLIFYRENCADMAISASDVDPTYIANAAALVVTGTHFSTPTVDAASRAAIAAARAAGTRVVLDIDYRPVLWGLTGRGDGETRFISSEQVSAHLQSIVPLCDLVVGTEEEIHIAGGSTDTVAALRRLRSLTNAVLVVKRGVQGATIFEAAIPDRFEEAIDCPGFPVEVFNVLGAGDGFMAGLLTGWISGKSWFEAGRTANACGALVVSRHACAPAMPSKIELEDFLERATTMEQVHKDRRLQHLHRMTTGRRANAPVFALAFDHRRQFEDLAAGAGAGHDRIHAFKDLIAKAAIGLSKEFDNFGVLVDEKFGRDVLDRLTGSNIWIGRPVEEPGSRPLAFEGERDPALALRSWPAGHVAKCLAIYDAGDRQPLREVQDNSLLALQRAAESSGHEWLLEIVPPRGVPTEASIIAAVEHFYKIGLMPDWWKLPPSPNPGMWRAVGNAIRANDPHARGILVLGLDMPESDLGLAFAGAESEPLVQGFAVGRTIFWPAAERWFKDEISNDQATSMIVDSFRRIRNLWPSPLLASG